MNLYAIIHKNNRMLKQTMKIALRTKSNRGRLIVPICEFSFAAYPVQINRVFRCLPVTRSPQSKSHDLQRNVSRGICL
jgi:hypothetical protein